MKYSIAIIAICLGTTLSLAQANDTLELGYINLPPLYYQNEEGEDVGEIIMFAKELFQDIGYTPQLRTRPPKRLLMEFIDGEFDVWIGIVPTPNFQELAHVGTVTVSELVFCTYSLTEENSISSLDALQGKKVVLIRGYNYGEWGEQIRSSSSNISYTDVSSVEAALNFLTLGRAEVLLSYQAPTLKFLENDHSIEIHEQEINRYPLVITVSKSTPNGEEILQKLEDCFIEMSSENGRELSVNQQ